jgi:hypothetical protein
MWLVANGSGHKISNETNVIFLITFFVLLLLLGCIIWQKRLWDKQKKNFAGVGIIASFAA